MVLKGVGDRIDAIGYGGEGHEGCVWHAFVHIYKTFYGIILKKGPVLVVRYLGEELNSFCMVYSSRGVGVYIGFLG